MRTFPFPLLLRWPSKYVMPSGPRALSRGMAYGISTISSVVRSWQVVSSGGCSQPSTSVRSAVTGGGECGSARGSAFDFFVLWQSRFFVWEGPRAPYLLAAASSDSVRLAVAVAWRFRLPPRAAKGLGHHRVQVGLSVGPYRRPELVPLPGVLRQSRS